MEFCWINGSRGPSTANVYPGMRFNISIAPFKAQKPAYKRVFYFFLNVGYTKPIVEKILSMFFEKCKHHVAIFSKNHLSRHLPQLRFRVCFFLPALCYQFTNDVRIPLIPLIIGQVWYQLLDNAHKSYIPVRHETGFFFHPEQSLYPYTLCTLC